MEKYTMNFTWTKYVAEMRETVCEKNRKKVRRSGTDCVIAEGKNDVNRFPV